MGASPPNPRSRLSRSGGSMRNRSRSALLVVLVAGAVFAAEEGTAFAQRHRGGGDWEPKSMGFRIGGEVDVWPTSDLGTTVAVDFQGQFALLRVLMLDVEVPTLVATDPCFDGCYAPAQFVFGNPTIGLH